MGGQRGEPPRCGSAYLIGCLVYSWHDPDKDHYRLQIEGLFERGLIDEHIRHVALETYSDRFNRERTYCTISWERLETVFSVLGTPPWHHIPFDEPPRGRGRRFLVEAYISRKLPWFVVNLLFRMLSPGLSQPTLSKQTVSRFKTRQRSRYSPTCRTNLALYFESLEDLEAEVALPEWADRLLREEGVGITPNSFDSARVVREWTTSEVRRLRSKS